ncbi:unnamed protein product [Rhizophagus irregularis]|nr:unnamed protein product [Rhizophagus irregularis]
MDEYERRYRVKYAAFSHMFYDADSNDNIKSNLLEISREFGNVEFDEMQLMVVYRSARNKVTHKRIWKPDETFVLPIKGKNSKTKWIDFNLFKVLEECKRLIVQSKAQRRILRSGIGKIIDYLYNISFVESRENFSLNCAVILRRS